ncbi:hypothetical protein [Actinomadura livida]|uniref:Uncharacterized protein n=1 Tax=Actinomadura livida TaxID=79909 RepID=A0A7W7MUQ6_9ACTN|nr:MULTISPECIES: hypothetical protein [Actinomadura]MBB4771788.1 hypothetical protein [Actinomadura catellatispora]GGU02497.1 hypothetical protein GCM10010208_28100 [Actinomadura livida]
MAGRWITKNGRPVRIDDGGGGKIVVAGLAAIMMAGSGGVVGGAAGAGDAPSLSAKTINARKGDAKRSARKGNADKAWRRLGMRQIRRSRDHPRAGCVRVTWGEVQQAAIRNPCTSLDRRLIAIADRSGNTALISVAWARFRNNGDRRRFQRVIDVYGTGDIKPLAASKLGFADIRFTGRFYHSIPKMARLTVAEAEAVKGTFNPEVLDGFAQVAAELPSPPNNRRRR